ncbi:MAG TPA: hypothetical protein VFE62_17030 [Gemmataceae bacterium]|nr:hypothetical protein [Gemmataceae bacterium]
MLIHNPFDDIPVLAVLDPEEIAARLRTAGEAELGSRIAKKLAEPPSEAISFALGSSKMWWWPFADRETSVWLHAAHVFGHISPAPPGDGALPIRPAGAVQPDKSLKRDRINIRLDRLRIKAYPGGGVHRVLLDFNAQNQVAGATEDLHFNATFRVPEGEHAGVVGHPIFLGLNVGDEGVAFRCLTVNVKNDEDEALLGFLESGPLQRGLELAATAQPAIGPLSQLALALTKSLAKRHQNVPVQEFYLGLDFTDIPTGARLAEGSYVAVQVPDSSETVWDWSDWEYHRSKGQIVKKSDATKVIPYNYLVFGVSRANS